jgi:hypothetical protein
MFRLVRPAGVESTYLNSAYLNLFSLTQQSNTILHLNRTGRYYLFGKKVYYNLPYLVVHITPSSKQPDV